MKRNFLLKIHQANKTYKYQTHFIRRFLKKTRTIKWQYCPIIVCLKVGYGKQVNWYGKNEFFYNEGVYKNREDFESALNAFIEED